MSKFHFHLTTLVCGVYLSITRTKGNQMVRLLIKSWLVSFLPGMFVLQGAALVLWVFVVPFAMGTLMECRRNGLI